jgi:hypothetical protein
MVDQTPNTATAAAPETRLSPAEKHAKDAGINNPIELVTVLVTVKKKTNIVGDVVPEHEVPLLRLIHLSENIEVKDKQYGTVIVENDPIAELHRLRQKYDDKHTGVVQQIYGSIDSIIRATGMTDDIDVTDDVIQTEQSVQVDKGRTASKAAAARVAAGKKKKGGKA